MYLQTFDSTYFRGKSYFEDDGTQNYFVLQPIYRCFKRIGNSKLISPWKSKRLCVESIKTPAISNNSLSPSLIYINAKIRIKFCLKQDKFTFHHETVVIIYIVHKINFWPFQQSADSALGNSFFGAVLLTKNAGFEKYKYSGYGIGFDAHRSFFYLIVMVLVNK